MKALLKFRLTTRVLWILLGLGALSSASIPAARAEKLGALSIAKFTTGLISAYALHETGHGIAAAVTGTEMEWGIGTYNQPVGFTERAGNDTEGLIVHASGLVTQVIGSEIILQSDIDKNDAFVRGMMAWNIINPLLYAADYWFIRRTNQEEGSYYQGDLEGFEHYSNEKSANIFAASMLTLGAYQGYRFIQSQNWAPEWMQAESVKVDFQAQPGTGVLLCLRIDF